METGKVWKANILSEKKKKLLQAHVQYVCSIFAKFHFNPLETVRDVDHTIYVVQAV